MTKELRVIANHNWLIPGFLAFTRDHTEIVREEHSNFFLLDLSLYNSEDLNLACYKLSENILKQFDESNKPFLCLISESINPRRVATLLTYFLTNLGYTPRRALSTVFNSSPDYFAGHINIEETLVSPKFEINSKSKALLNLLMLIKTLREVCPWDKELTFSQLLTLTWEETNELWLAYKYGKRQEIIGELGDLLLHILLYTLIYEESNQVKYSFNELVGHLRDKLIKRHSHVFSEDTVKTAGEAIEIWNKNKEKEKSPDELIEIIIDSPSALFSARKVQETARKKGFDFKNYQDPLHKVLEEYTEVCRAIGEGETGETKFNTILSQELGDLLFSIVNLSRHLNIDAEEALKSSTLRFSERLSKLSELTGRQNNLDPYELNHIWENIKKQEGN